jgi:XTP/dITP diphosphohydrolase
LAKLLLATNNEGKGREFQALLANESFDLTTPQQEGLILDVDESGETLEENAAKKALAFLEASGLPSLADDSGLFVDYLDGAPGVHSARYAGPNASDDDRVTLLIDRLSGVVSEDRTACFRAVIAIAAPNRSLFFSNGECCGIISLVRSGKNGFGYDPIFHFPEHQKTMAELEPELKNTVSHRSRALRAAIPALHDLFADQR